MTPTRRDLSRDQRRIFVNREGPIEIIERTSRSIPRDGCRLLVFHGPGGQGKTALCRHVRELLDAQDRPVGKLRVGELDLHGRDKSDPDRLLVWVRNSFAKAGVGMPAFDLSFAVAWEANRAEEPFPRLVNPWLARTSELIPEGASDGVTSVREILEDSVDTIPLLGPLVTRGANWMIDRGKKAWLERTRTHLAHLYDGRELKKPHELSDLMPWMLAQDLNHHLENFPDDRFVLLIDEYERVFDQGGAGRRWEENPLDALMRQLIAETNGLLGVFFTRERLPWEADADWRDTLEGCHHRLEGLADDYASAWLIEEGVEDAAIRASMIEGAREEAREDALVYPLLLELQVAHWSEVVRQGEIPRPDQFSVHDPDFSARCRTLLTRVLRDYGEPWQFTLERLCVCNRFDEVTFDHVIDAFGTGLPKDSFERLETLSFMTQHDDGFLVMHRVVSDTLRAAQSDERVTESTQALLEHFEARARAPNPRDISEGHRSALSEAIALRKTLGAEGFASWLADLFGPFRMAAAYGSGEHAWRDTLGFLRESFGEEHPDTAMSYNNVAYNLNAQGRYAEAEPLYRKSLDICARTLGEEHPDTAASYNNVAANLHAQGRYAEAEPLLRKGLDIRARTLGEEHPHTAQSYNNVAANLGAQGRYAEAEPLYRKGLDIHARSLGEEHPDTAGSYNNVATNLHEQGRYAEAEPLLRKGLDIRARTLGEEHPDTAQSYNNLAYNLDAQGRYAEAEPLYRKAVAAMEQALGPDHPHSRMVRGNLEALLAKKP